MPTVAGYLLVMDLNCLDFFYIENVFKFYHCHLNKT